MATVHPYKGYLNTEFRLYASGTGDISYSILSDNSEKSAPVASGVFTPNIPHSIKLKNPGKYQIIFNDGSSSNIIVEDGYKFGGSHYKASYIFDNTPWCMVVMYDRTYFYNRKTEESYVEAISPDSIEEISQDYVILKNKGQVEITLFNLNKQKPILCFSDLIYSTEETIIWKDADCLVIYSLPMQKVVHRIETCVYSCDKDKNQLIFSKQYDVLCCNLSDKYEISTIFSQKGKLITFVDNELSIYCYYSFGVSTIRIYKLHDPSYIKELSVKGYVARINDVELINTEHRSIAIYQFDLEHSDFPEATIEVSYSDFIFYPCSWDVFYVQRDTKFKKTSLNFKREQEIHLRSLETKLDQIFSKFDNNTIINSSRFVIYNDSESFVRSQRYYAADYISGGKILTHHDRVIRVSDGCFFTLSRNGYWDNCEECNYDFSLFEKYGIVKDNETGIYQSLCHNIKGKNIQTCYNPIYHIELGGYIILEGGKIFSRYSDLRKFSVKPFAVSPNLRYGVIIENNRIYLLDISSKEESKKQILTNIFDASNYHDVILGDDGKQILYRDSEITRVTDIITGETFDFGNMSYVQQSNGMRVQFQRSGSLQPRIVDPITGQMLDADLMRQYNFISPDGHLYADTLLDKYLEYYYIETNEIISSKEYHTLYDNLKFPSRQKKDTNEWEQVKLRRIDFVKKHYSFLNKTYSYLFHDDPTGEKWEQHVIGDKTGLDVSIFIHRVIAIRGIVVIRDTSSDKEIARIDLGRPLSFLNYVSFSRDSRYIAIAGYRDFSNGLFLIYDLKEHKILCHNNTSRAVWTTAFSVNGHIAAYTSDPNTIYFDSNYSYEANTDFQGHLILGRTFLTFSPDGNLIALSDQGYTPKNGTEYWGHQPSTFVEIRDANIYSKILATYNDLSNNGIDNTSRSKSVASVSFSNDNKRLMMVGKDGVVIIRNLHL